MGSRLVAGLCDAALVGSAIVALYLVSAADWSTQVFFNVLDLDGDSDPVDAWDPSTALLLTKGAWFAAGLLMLRFAGGTFGKLFVGLRVVTVDGEPLRLRHATLRMIVWAPVLIPGHGLDAASIAAVALLISIIAGGATERSLADRIAGTRVVFKSQR